MLQVFDERNWDLIVSVGGRLTHRDSGLTETAAQKAGARN
jgi:hypothetical protein